MESLNNVVTVPQPVEWQNSMLRYAQLCHGVSGVGGLSFCSRVIREHVSCYGLKVCFPQNSYVEILIPSVMVLGDGTWGSA